MMTSLEEIKYCLESNFIIDLLKGKANAVQVYEEIKDAPLAITAIASVALFEILRGKEQNQDKIRRFEELRQKMTVLPFGEIEAEEASQIEKAIHQKGQSISPLDLLIGATAKTNGAILISNDSDYKRIDGLQLRNY
ncbi:MAG: type II toxin-antitoxin system VapC family toxin [Candidatus Komeilibacteria bacterium]|nr:type II toxin-antitoxin system VapC family toxin [Candidatus Komeilibacteria bacterium]